MARPRGANACVADLVSLRDAMRYTLNSEMFSKRPFSECSTEYEPGVDALSSSRMHSRRCELGQSRTKVNGMREAILRVERGASIAVELKCWAAESFGDRVRGRRRWRSVRSQASRGPDGRHELAKKTLPRSFRRCFM